MQTQNGMTFSAGYGRQSAVLAALLLAGAVAGPVFAAPADALDAVSISIGEYFVSPTTNVGVNTRYGSGDSGDISSHAIQVPRINADFLLGDHQGFAFDYYGFYRNYADTFTRALSTDRSDLSALGNSTANVGLDVANASYKWWFGHAADVVGLGVGAAYYRIHIGVDASAANYSADAVAPLIQFGWRHAFSPATRAYVDISGIEKSGGNLNGHIYNAAIGAEWYFAKHLGVGAEYSATRVSINVDDNNESLNVKLDGPTLFLKARF